jgi:uncharacterized protein (DUF1697 family)
MLYVALLRGINVGGHTVKMDRLRDLFRDLGLDDVRSYIQSGNVFFETNDTESAALATRIERHLHEALGYEVPVFLRSAQQLQAILALDPFAALDVTPEMRLCVVFTDTPIPVDTPFPVRSVKGDVEVVGALESDAFMVWHIINGRPVATSSYRFDFLAARNTTRFFHTLVKIVAAATGG